MNEILIPLSVLGAVLLFGALITLGNERQRHAIDQLTRQAARWSESDLRLKRAEAVQKPLVKDPTEWLYRVAIAALGEASPLFSLTPWKPRGETLALVGHCSDGRRLVLTHLPPRQFLPLVKVQSRGRASRAEVSLLGDRPNRTPVVECSIVNAGIFFDLEAAETWNLVAGEPLTAERMYLFEVPSSNHSHSK